jgi:hypothetical protein
MGAQAGTSCAQDDTRKEVCRARHSRRDRPMETVSRDLCFREFSGQNLVVRRGVSLRKTRVFYGSKVSSRCLRSVMVFCRVLASVELLKNRGRFTTPSKVPVPSDHKSLCVTLVGMGYVCHLGCHLIGDLLRPKSFAGLFGAAPSVALASLALTIASEGKGYAAVESRSMMLTGSCLLTVV